MSCAIVEILQAEKIWLESLRKQAMTRGNTTQAFDEAWIENHYRLSEHRRGASCWCEPMDNC